MDIDGDSEDILSKEWLRLSLKERNDIQEEIHSVLCMAKEESPEMIQKALENLSFELDNNIPAGERRAYMRYQKYCEKRKESGAISITPSYISEDDFRLRFLRNELFDVPKAARRMCRFLNCILETYGEESLKKSINLAMSFSKEELRVLKSGLLQLLPYRDRLGRRILVIFPGRELGRMPTRIKMKILLYMFYVAGSSDDVDIQRKGIVLVAWFDPTTKLDEMSQIRSNTQSLSTLYPLLPTRVAALHMCTPDTPMFSFRMSVMAAALSLYGRTRMKLHIGTPMELRYILNGYGIPTDTLPISWTGNIKTSYLKQWIKLRQFIEKEDDQSFTQGSFSKTMTGTLRQSVVECPNLNDIIFKKGSSGMQHPGNARFRSLVQSKYEQGNLFTTKSLIMAVLEEIEKQCLRVLIWSEKHSCYLILRDKKTIYKKIEYLVRDFQFSSNRSQTINRKIADEVATDTSVVDLVVGATRTTDASTKSTFAEDGSSRRKRFKPSQFNSNSGDGTVRNDIFTESSCNCNGKECLRW